ncbi:hypothetical protein HYH03_003584 [Edaphochlamys debaryana]|uniref:Uncharacterized protein n=1 Tax=Edaphochlamys debaryana TaxID=47281 RepID=A0A836C432_9CHLO|nr:hypothetical protein HYH03_003584 [Edaphochlamys debaryana]|eukprot:KAG2498324.1 hypothetical protein HYH03_003584 [Edaphochlamys debaryana]
MAGDIVPEASSAQELALDREPSHEASAPAADTASEAKPEPEPIAAAEAKPEPAPEPPPSAPPPPEPQPEPSAASTAASVAAVAEATPAAAATGSGAEAEAEAVPVWHCAASLAFLQRFAAETVQPGWTTYDILKQVVLPSTSATKCRYVDTLPPGSSGTLTYFVSYAWSMPFHLLVELLSHHLASADAERVYCWVDVLAINQHPGRQQARDLENLEEAVRLAEGTLVCLDPGCVPFTRIWCLFEWWTTLRMRGVRHLSFLADPSTRRRLGDMYQGIDIRKAQATVDSDRERILGAIGDQLDLVNAQLKLLFLLEPYDTSAVGADLLLAAASAAPTANGHGPHGPGGKAEAAPAARAHGGAEAVAVEAWAREGVELWLDLPPEDSQYRALALVGPLGCGKSTAAAAALAALAPPAPAPTPARAQSSAGAPVAEPSSAPAPGGTNRRRRAVAAHYCLTGDAASLDPLVMIRSLAFQLAVMTHGPLATFLRGKYLGLSKEAIGALNRPEWAFSALLQQPLAAFWPPTEEEGDGLPPPRWQIQEREKAKAAADEAAAKGLGNEDEVLLLVDGADEAEGPRGLPQDNRILLALRDLFPQLPPRVRLVVTTRPRPDHVLRSLVFKLSPSVASPMPAATPPTPGATAPGSSPVPPLLHTHAPGPPAHNHLLPALQRLLPRPASASAAAPSHAAAAASSPPAHAPPSTHPTPHAAPSHASHAPSLSRAYAALFTAGLAKLSTAERAGVGSLLELLLASPEPLTLNVVSRLGLAPFLPLLPGWRGPGGAGAGAGAAAGGGGKPRQSGGGAAEGGSRGSFKRPSSGGEGAGSSAAAATEQRRASGGGAAAADASPASDDARNRGCFFLARGYRVGVFHRSLLDWLRGGHVDDDGSDPALSNSAAGLRSSANGLKAPSRAPSISSPAPHGTHGGVHPPVSPGRAPSVPGHAPAAGPGSAGTGPGRPPSGRAGAAGGGGGGGGGGGHDGAAAAAVLAAAGLTLDEGRGHAALADWVLADLKTAKRPQTYSLRYAVFHMAHVVARGPAAGGGQAGMDEHSKRVCQLDELLLDLGYWQQIYTARLGAGVLQDLNSLPGLTSRPARDVVRMISRDHAVLERDPSLLPNLARETPQGSATRAAALRSGPPAPPPSAPPAVPPVSAGVPPTAAVPNTSAPKAWPCTVAAPVHYAWPPLLAVVSGEAKGSRHAGVMGMAVAPDGATFATANNEGSVLVHDMQSGERVLRMTGHIDHVTCVTYVPYAGSTATSYGLSSFGSAGDGSPATAAAAQRITRGSTPGGVGGSGRLTGLSGSGTLALALAGARRGPRRAAYIASGGADRTVRLWDPVTGEPLALLTVNAKPVTAVAASADGRLLAATDEEGAVCVWRLQQPAGPDRASTPTRVSTPGAAAGTGAFPANLPIPIAEPLFTEPAPVTEPIYRRADAPPAPTRRTRLRHPPASTNHSAAANGHATMPTANSQPVAAFCAAFAPDGLTLATGAIDGSVRLWDVTGGSQMALLDAKSVMSAAASAAAGGTSPGATGPGSVTPAASFNRSPVMVKSLAYSPDGFTMLMGLSNGDIGVWRRPAGPPTPGSPRGRPKARSAEAKDRKEAAASGDGGWSVAAVLRGHSGDVGGLVVDGDCRIAFSASNDKQVRVWDLLDARELAVLYGHTDYAVAADLSYDGATLATGSADGTVRLWDARGAATTTPAQQHGLEVMQMSVAPINGFVATASKDKTVGIWALPLPPPQPQQAPEAPADPAAPPPAPEGDNVGLMMSVSGRKGIVATVALAPDEVTLASGSYDCTIMVYRLDRPSHPELVLTAGHKAFVTAVAFDAWGSRLVSGGGDGSIAVWDAAAWQTTHWGADAAAPSTPRISTPDGAAAHPWMQPLVIETKPQFRSVWALACSPTDYLFAGGHGGMQLSIWDGVQPGKQRPESLLYAVYVPVDGNTNGHVYGVAWAPDGKRLAAGYSGYRGGHVRVWDITTGQEAANFRAHDQDVWSVAFDPTAPNLLASCSYDGLAAVWNLADLRSPRCIAQMRGHKGALRSVAFVSRPGPAATATPVPAVPVEAGAPEEGVWGEAGDGGRSRFVVTAGTDSTVRVWSLAEALKQRDVNYLCPWALTG